MFLLDSNTCIHLLRGTNPAVHTKFFSLLPSQISLCSVVKGELEYGARHSSRVEANLERLRKFYQPLTSFSFDNRCAEEYGQIRAALVSEGNIIGANDLMIAAIARANDLTLVSHNTREFRRVVGLRLEDWEA